MNLPFSRDEAGRVVVNVDHIARSRLRVESRKWLLSKLVPKQYGDKVVQEITGADGAQLPVMVYLPSNGRDRQPEAEGAE